MRAAAEVTALVPERSADPLEHVDYRLAETPEEKDDIYRLRYRAYLRGEWRGSPSSEMFSEMLHPQLDRGKTIIDPTRFVADPDKARVFPELPYVTVRLGYIACGHFNADIGLANVRPEHRAFYKKVFLQTPMGEPKLFPGLIKPVGLMAANYHDIRDRVFQRFPFMRSSAFERRMLFQRAGERQFSPKGVVTSFERASIVPNA